MAMPVEATAAPKRKRKVLDHIRVKSAKSGGHIVEHHYDNSGPGYREPDEHVFGKDQGEELLAHVAKHAKVNVPVEEEGEEGEGGEAY